MTNAIEAEAKEYIRKIDEMGGAVEAIDKGYIQKEIQDAAYAWQMSVESGERTIVGVNKFTMEEPPVTGLLKIDASVGEKKKAQLAQDKANRDQAKVAEELAKLEKAPEVSAIRDADRIIGLLEANNLRDIHLIINRLRPEMIARGDMMSVDDVTEILAVDLIGTLLDDEQIVVATNQGEPLSGRNSQAEEEYRNICRRLMGEEVPFVQLRQKKGRFARLFRKH